MESSVFATLARKYGSPLYVFDLESFKENYFNLVNSFQRVYPDYRLSYSYKTNYVPFICERIREYGGYAEVVSDMEYTLAKKLGYSNNHIIYNGPVKGPLMVEHLLNGGILNIDNLDEAISIRDIALKNPSVSFKLGIRVNLDVTQDFISRFGFELNGSDLAAATSILKQCSNISIVGVHGHSGHARSISSWQHRVDTLLRASDMLIDDVPSYISLGSGMFGKMDPRLSAQFNCQIPSYSDYASAVFTPILEHYSSSSRKPIVFTEPGATVISRYVYFLTCVKNIKQIRGKHFAATDGSFYNIGEICKGKALPLDIIPLGKNRHYYDSIDIVGFTCLEYDTLFRAYSGSLSVGDLLLFGNVGGYSVVCKPQFIQPNCPMVSVDKQGTIIEIQRKETFDDVFNKFHF